MPNIRLGQRGQQMTGQLVARIAKRWVGQGYVFGGSASSPGDWDCSSFVSFVLHQAGLALPNGKWGDPGFPPTSHGPVVVDYANWNGATPVGQPAAGDLCCWVGLGANGHIGIAISGTRMVSALNPSIGTLETPIVGTGPSGAPLVYRRINGLAGVAGPPVLGGAGSQHPPIVVAAVVAGLYAGALVLVALGAAGLVAGAGWAMGKARQ